MTNIRKVYFMGIKGVGMASIALIAKEAGFIVSGSDVDDEFITDEILKKSGIEVLSGFDQANPSDFFGTTPANECLMIITGAHQGYDNPEAIFAQNKGIEIITHGEAVGLFMKGAIFDREFTGISVAGSHGKTTISALLSVALAKLGQDPTYTIGTSEIIPIGASGHFGKGRFFVAEADEYMAAPTIKKPKFLYQFPKYLIINNIDFDHPDFFADIEAVKAAFRDFIANLGPDGVLIANGDDENVRQIVKEFNSLNVIYYGTGDQNDFKITNFEKNGFGSRFSVTRGDTLIGRFSLSVPGYHNAKNSLAAIAFLLETGVSAAEIERVLPEFGGSKRRIEQIGTTESGAIVLDDYAHHPEEIRKTLEAIRETEPDKKIILVFQAHTSGRTRALESEFISALAAADELIIMPTFASARDMGANIGEDSEFVEKIRLINTNVKLIEDADGVVKYLTGNSNSGSIVLTMGAGDVYKVGKKLVTK